MTIDQSPTEPPLIDDKPSGMVERSRLQALADRVGPSLDVMRRRPWILLLALLAFMSLVTLLSVQWVLSALVHARKEVAVPDLSGKTALQALDLLSPLNLSLAKDTVQYDESLPSGAILRQLPPAGMKVREGKVVHVTLSSGGQAVFVPGLVNKPMTEAQNLLRSAGLLPGAVTETYSQNYEAGWVMEQTPTEGAALNRGQMVDLRVSKGPPPEGTLLMPNFVNRPLDQAQAWAKENQLKMEIKEETGADVLPGLVMRQSPVPDALITPAQSLQFVVSKSTATLDKAEMIRYEIPAGSDRVQVRIVVRDEKGEKEVFQGYQDAGSLVEVPVAPEGIARARIFVNGVLIEERLLQ